jgi:pilus assembly protein Flp/PilA
VGIYFGRWIVNRFSAFLRDESGASAAEYVLILTIIGTVLVTAIGTLRTAIGGALTRAATAIGAYTYT